MDTSAVIEIDRVTFGYDAEPVLEDASLTVSERDFVSIVGPNGGGKTTLLKLLLGLVEPSRGSVCVFGEAPARVRRRIGYLPQQARLDLEFPVCVLDVVLLGRLGHARLVGPFRAEDRDAARQALQEVGLSSLANRSFAALSGGQRQRVLIARALACAPDMLLLDEPTSNLDIRVQDELHELLNELSRRVTVMSVSHDVGFVSKYVKKVVCVNRRVHVHSGRELDREAIIQLYGRDVRLLHHEHEGPCAHRDEGRG